MSPAPGDRFRSLISRVAAGPSPVGHYSSQYVSVSLAPTSNRNYATRIPPGAIPPVWGQSALLALPPMPCQNALPIRFASSNASRVDACAVKPFISAGVIDSANSV